VSTGLAQFGSTRFGALVYGLIESAQVGFNDRSVIIALAAGIVVFDFIFCRRNLAFRNRCYR